MYDLKKLIQTYLDYCHYQKRLSSKTTKAYKTDLQQFLEYMETTDMQLNKPNITNYITELYRQYQPRTIKRKIASVKAFFSYLEYEEILPDNPFHKIKLKTNEPKVLPRTIPLDVLSLLFITVYNYLKKPSLTESQLRATTRNIAVLELLFSTGIRVSELCSLRLNDIDLNTGRLCIHGKGSKDRTVVVVDSDVMAALRTYYDMFQETIHACGYFFCNRLGKRLSEQSVRFMIKRYAKEAGIEIHITPHMFRHTFATELLEKDVNIRCIQEILGHSSITTTQIYTHVSPSKQRDILYKNNPRKKLCLSV